MRQHRRPVRTLLAYHEAGHAVVGCALGYAVRLVTIQPTPESHGHCSIDAIHSADPLHDSLISVAGDVAVELYEPGGRERLRRHANDFALVPLPAGLPEAVVAALREPLPCDCGHAIAALERGATRGSVAGPPRSLSEIARDPRRLWEQGIRLAHQAADVLEANWLAVEQIAAELLSVGEVRGRANELFEGARGLRRKASGATPPRGAA